MVEGLNEKMFITSFVCVCIYSARINNSPSFILIFIISQQLCFKYSDSEHQFKNHKVVSI